MQELMQWMEETEFMVNVGFIDKVNECLEKEKEHIENSFNYALKMRFGSESQINTGEEYYNQTYNQNK